MHTTESQLRNLFEAQHSLAVTFVSGGRDNSRRRSDLWYCVQHFPYLSISGHSVTSADRVAGLFWAEK